jgi:prepilin-type N-terminal cleavage/methylation domain-containing protein
MVTRRFGQEHGFTLPELMLAVAIGLIVMGMAMGGVSGMIKSSRADGGLSIAASGLRAAREAAISSRRNVRVTFTTNQIINTRVEYCAAPCTPPLPNLTTVRTTTLEGRVVFRPPTGISSDPDGFGNTATDGINLGGGTCTTASTAACPMFTTDGSFINSSGDVQNGTIFLGVPSDIITTRAISIFGPTGAMRLWKWDGRAWVEV